MANILKQIEDAGFDLTEVEAALNARKGAVKSEAKTKAAAANGKLGGRPAIRQRAVKDAKVYLEQYKDMDVAEVWARDSFEIFVEESKKSESWANKNFPVYYNTFLRYAEEKRSN